MTSRTFSFVPLLAALLLGLLPLGGHARSLAGVTLADGITLDGHSLQLNGAGIREKFFFDIYVGALYLPQRTRDAEQAIAQPGAKRVLMHFLYDAVSREKLVDGWNEGFEHNLDRARRAALQPRIDAFNALFVDVKRGDVITLDGLPGKGTRVSLNGRPLGQIDGDDFFTALLRIWLGDEPADDDLKQALLGED